MFTRERSPECRQPTLTVYHDGSCPLCSREIAFYRRRRGAAAIRWVDLTEIQGEKAADDLTRDAAMARFHVRAADGTLLSGGAAFRRLWSALPGFRFLGAVTGLPGISTVLEWSYRLSLRLRARITRRLRP